MERELLKLHAKKVLVDVIAHLQRVQSLEDEIIGLKKEFSSKDEKIKADEESILALEASIREMDDLITEVSTRAAMA